MGFEEHEHEGITSAVLRALSSSYLALPGPSLATSWPKNCPFFTVFSDAREEVEAPEEGEEEEGKESQSLRRSTAASAAASCVREGRHGQ